jgi:Spy/CpxP family protein refolding chaperone
MSLKTKIFSSLTMGFAVVAFSSFASAQTAGETPVDGAKKVERHDRKGFGKRGHGKMGRHGGPGKGMGGFRGIELSEAQKGQMKAIREANKPDAATIELMKSIRETRKTGGTISEDQKAQLKSLRESQKAKRESIRQQMEAILTPEQKAQIEAKKVEMKKRFEERRQLREQRKAAEAKPAEVTSN